MPTNAFLGVFAKSPIKPMEDHIKKAHQASKALIPFFNHVFKEEWQEAEEIRLNIRNLEREADEMKRNIRLQLPRGLFMPVERTDLLELVTQQDKIANKAKDIAGRVVGREMTIPTEIQADFLAYVTRCVELKARFDEQNNIEWAKTLSNAGVKVIFGIPALKVHSKLCVIHRKEKNNIVKYAHIGTGNFHEKTAKIYTDFSLFTKHEGISEECDSVFKFIESSYRPFQFDHLMISPVNARQTIMSLIDAEVTNVEHGKAGRITLKINNLVDKELVDHLYFAARRGVKIRIIVRGMCSLVPSAVNDNIRIISIVDRFLEHPRVMVFHNNGDEKVYISSADWMTRNLDHRVEVATPIYNEKLKQLIIDILELQFKDRSKARIIDSEQKNSYVRRGNRKKIRSQIAIYDHLKKWESNYNNE
jgi:polyphosphate kinase